MRLFVAIDPPATALAELEQAVAPLRPDWPDLRWASLERWHVTLAFLGEVPEARLERLQTRLERAAGHHAAPAIRIGRGGAFPSAARARVLCSHIEGDRPDLTELSALAASVAAGARRAGAPPPDEGRRYRPHLTLARCRQPANLTSLVGLLAGFAGSVWDASSIHLVRSMTGPQPRYETVGTWPLSPRRPDSARPVRARSGRARSDAGVEDAVGARNLAHGPGRRADVPGTWPH
jgi:RNA 2',3'-cyclic 3'-phosphodiesterase